MICIRGHRTISLREGSHENTAQIAPKCLTAACRAGIGAAKKAATRGNRCGASGKTFQYRNCKGDDDASTSRKSKNDKLVCRSRKGGGDAAKLFLPRISKFQKGEK